MNEIKMYAHEYAITYDRQIVGTKFMIFCSYVGDHHLINNIDTVSEEVCNCIREDFGTSLQNKGHLPARIVNGMYVTNLDSNSVEVEDLDEYEVLCDKSQDFQKKLYRKYGFSLDEWKSICEGLRYYLIDLENLNPGYWDDEDAIGGYSERSFGVDMLGGIDAYDCEEVPPGDYVYNIKPEFEKRIQKAVKEYIKSTGNKYDVDLSGSNSWTYFSISRKVKG